jgi:co-chaperonin GroES (HSP10)
MSELKPTGHYVLVEDEPFEKVSDGGIIIASETESKREEEGMEMGRILAFGPIAYKDVKGCSGPEDWGIAIGDLVEYSGRYEGKKSAFCRENKLDQRRLRLVPDISIVSKLEES